MIPYKQLSLADIFQDCQNKFDNDKSSRIYSQLKTSYCLGLTNSIKSMAYLSAPKIKSYPLFIIKIMLCTIPFIL